MAKHSIEIAVKAAREQVASARRKVGEAAFGGGRSGFGRTDNRLTRSIEKNIQAQNQATAIMKQNVRAALDLRNHIRALGSTIRRHGVLGTARGAAGAAFGGLKSAVPMLGFLLSGFLLLMNKAVQAGRAAMAATEQQAGTAGLGGFQTRGAGTWTAAEIGRFEYERRAARGGGESPRVGTRRTALSYARMAGVDPSEIARTVGMFEVQGGGFERALARMRKEELDVAQFRTIFQELIPALEEATAGGIVKSGLGADIAKNLSVMARYFPGGVGARAAAATYRTFRSITSQAARGEWANMQGMRVMRAARRMAERPGGIEEMTRKGSESLFAGEDPREIRQRMRRNMVFRQAVLQQIAARRSPGVMMQYFRDLRKDLSGAMPAGMSEKMQNVLMARMAQGTGQGMGLTLNQLAAGFAMSRKRPEELKPEDINRVRTMFKTPQPVEDVLKHRVAREQQLLNVAASFIPLVKNLDNTAMSLAIAGRDLGAGPMNQLAKSISGAAEQVPGLIKGMKDLMGKIGELMPRDDENPLQWFMRVTRNTGKSQ